MRAKNFIIMALVAGGLAPAAASADETSLGMEVPDADSLVRMLAPDEPQATSAGSGAKTRSISVEPLHQAIAPPMRPRSVSLQIPFEYNSDRLGEEALRQLRPVGRALASDRLKTLSFVLEGHTDSVGSAEANLRLSERRAAAVKRFLIGEYGIEPERLTSLGKGEAEPLDTSHPESAVNRRVRIVASSRAEIRHQQRNTTMQQQPSNAAAVEPDEPRSRTEQKTIPLPHALDFPAQVEPGQLLKDRFLVESELGRGGMGVVYKALDQVRRESHDPHPHVALKVLNPVLASNEMLRIALQRECKRSQGLRHPNIIAVHDFDRDGPYVFMTMEYLEGATLAEAIRQRRGEMDPAEAWPWIEAMGQALAFAHRNGIVHSDFKPENVFITRQGQIKVMDFGVARHANRNQGSQTIIDGGALGAHTPSYASLEMLRGEPTDPADDMFGYACTVYELLGGTHPYAYLSALQAKALDMRPKRLAKLDKRQWLALLRALSLDRKERGASLDQFLDEFRPRRVRSPRWPYVLLAGACALLIAAVYITRPFDPQPAPTSGTQATAEAGGLASAPRAAPPEAMGAPEFPAAPQLSEEVIEQLGQFRAVGERLDIGLGLDRQRFRVGDRLQLRFAVAEPAHVYVVALDPANGAVLLYPNAFQEDLTARGNEVHPIPPADAAGFVLRVGKPAGRHQVLAIASKTKLANVAERSRAGLRAFRQDPGVSLAEITLDIQP